MSLERSGESALACCAASCLDRESDDDRTSQVVMNHNKLDLGGLIIIDTLRRKIHESIIGAEEADKSAKKNERNCWGQRIWLRKKVTAKLQTKETG